MLFIWCDWWVVGDMRGYFGGVLVKGELEHGACKIVLELNVLLQDW